ncbi:MAG TPA: methyltransferase domain-containing protein [Pyrinomonadaceae bacterium]|jgi:SAM-dependent methyltransferase|nr:methyltransferase domain-containing protein [Pyrinomonadaceae bacterium]
MKNRLLQYLACPACEGELALASVAARDEARGWVEILEGELACKRCARRFAVRRGVPRFVEAGEIEEEKAATAENFGWQWQHFTQTDARYDEQFRGWLAPVAPEFFRDKLVLEGGCGKGRHTQLAAAWGAREVVGIDLSGAVETAFAATRDLPNAHIVQADIYRLPLKRRAFDYAFSVGVLHHLPDPRAGFVALSTRVRVGGHLSAWVYGAENNEWITRFVSPLRERVTSRISRGALLHLSKLPTALVYAATKLVYAPLNRSARGAALARHLFYNDYLKSIASFGWREQHTIVFDHLVAPTAFYISRAEFEDWWREIKATDVQTSWHNQNSWRGFGRIAVEQDGGGQSPQQSKRGEDVGE